MRTKIMARKKTISETPAEETVTVNAEDTMSSATQEPKVAAEESEGKKAFRAYMENYKVVNPTKYARKEPEFIKHLNSL
jgi:hypothetical protein